MDLPRVVKYMQCDLFQCGTPFAAATITFTDILRTGYDILFKIMGGCYYFILLCIFICDTVTKSHPGCPDQFRSHDLHDPF